MGSGCCLMRVLCGKLGKCWLSLGRFICYYDRLSSSRKGFSISRGSIITGTFPIIAFCY